MPLSAAVIGGLLSVGSMIQSQINSSASVSLTEKAMLSANIMSLFEIQRDAVVFDMITKSKYLDKIFENIQQLVSLKNELEERITCILSDYTQLMNQVSLVATLMLIVTSGTLGALLGNTENQVKWKIDMFVISCVFTMLISVCSVVESFFTSMLIYESEAKFSAGLMSKKGLRTFDPKSLKSINKSFAFVVITFFLSFLTFPFTILSMVYVGLGLSNFYIGGDSRMAAMNPVFNASVNTLSSFEPEYVSIALTLTCLIAAFYILFLWRFFSTYLKWIAWPWDCCGILKRTLLLTPLEETSKEYDNLQRKLHNYISHWDEKYRALNFIEMALQEQETKEKTPKPQGVDYDELLTNYKIELAKLLTESQENIWNTIESIRQTNLSTNKSKRNKRNKRNKQTMGSKPIEMKTFHYTEREPLLF